MRERPILFSDEMVRAILDGRKTQTRRIIKPVPPPQSTWDVRSRLFSIPGSALGVMRHCPYGSPGDWLWVREAWAWFGREPDPDGIQYRADYRHDDDDGSIHVSWRPSIYMPRWASRLTLEIIDVRVERLQNITFADVIAESTLNFEDFQGLWDSLNAKRGYSWKSNPWVWVIAFETRPRGQGGAIRVSYIG